MLRLNWSSNINIYIKNENVISKKVSLDII